MTLRPRLANSLRAALVVAAGAVVGVGGAEASGGGVSPTGGTGVSTHTPSSGCPNKQLGKRTLRLGDCGGDVATLNWILKAKHYGRSLAQQFADPTRSAVKAFQTAADLRPDGVFDATTSAALVDAMAPQRASWYGPGFFGNKTACGQTLTRKTVGVAHKTLPCGTKVVLSYKGRFLRTTVIDRGPYANNAKWDITEAAAHALRFEGVERRARRDDRPRRP